jgi:hypothetical protein
MVRKSEDRTAKYTGKIDADVMKTRVTAMRPIMISQQGSRLSELADLEVKIKAILEDPPVGITIFTYQFPAYLSYGKELYGKVRRFNAQALTKEAQLVMNKWASRGLICDILNRIASIFGIRGLVCAPSPYY